MAVVTFPGNPPPDEPERLIWFCTCGCQSFELYADGSTECCNCGKVDYGKGEWVRLLPAVPETPKEQPYHGTIVTRIGNTGAAIKKALADANDEDTAFVVVCQNNGELQTWKGRQFDDSDNVSWLDDQLERARANLLPVGTNPADLDGLRARITSSKELHSVIVVRQDGDVAVWVSAVSSPPEGEAQVAWLDRKLGIARELYLDKDYKPPSELQPDLFAEPTS